MSLRPTLAILAALFLASPHAGAVESGPAPAAPKRAKLCGQLFADALEVGEKLGRLARIPKRKLEAVYGRLMVGKTFENFSFEIFDDSLARFRADPELVPTFRLFEEEAAYWEAALERLAPKGSTLTLRPLLESQDWMTRYEIHRSIRGEQTQLLPWLREIVNWSFELRGALDPSSGVRQWQIRRFVNDLYLMHNLEVGPSLRELLDRKSGELLDAKLERLAMREVEVHGLETFLKERGLLADAQVADRMRKFQESEFYAILLTAYLNIRFFNGILPAYIPVADFQREIRKLGPELYTKGLKELWPRVKLEFRSIQERQAVYDAVRDAWYYARWTLAGVVAVAALYKGDPDKPKKVDRILDRAEERARQMAEGQKYRDSLRRERRANSQRRAPDRGDLILDEK
jgi:hypothetical protein